jgi:hypothetical protein
VKTWARRNTRTVARAVGTVRTAKRATAAVVALAVSGGVALAGAPGAAAAEDPGIVRLSYTATSFVGSVNWFARSVRVDGQLRALSGSCRRVLVQTFNSAHVQLGAQSTSLQCGVSEQHITVPADVPGGAAFVWVIFKGPSDQYLDGCEAQPGFEYCE